MLLMLLLLVFFFFFSKRFCGKLSMSINLLYGTCIHVIFRFVIDDLVNFTIAFGDYYVKAILTSSVERVVFFCKVVNKYTAINFIFFCSSMKMRRMHVHKAWCAGLKKRDEILEGERLDLDCHSIEQPW